MSNPKKLNFEVVSRDDNPEPYRLLAEVREQYHSDLREADIVLAWNMHVKPDVDGHTLLGKCVKVSDLYKEFAEHDFIIVLNKDVWDSLEFDRAKKVALLDHELCHAAIAEDEEGCTKRDERGRPVFRTRKHDIEEFGSVVKHHGCYKRDLEAFADLLIQRRKSPLFGSDPNNKNDDTVVSIQMQNERGEMETVLPPMPVSEFTEHCEALSKS